MQRPSIFDEKHDLIQEMFINGASVKQIHDALGSEEEYAYQALYAYITREFGKVNQRKVHTECQKCKFFFWAESPYKKGKLPVCTNKKLVFCRDLSDTPFKCEMEVTE